MAEKFEFFKTESVSARKKKQKESVDQIYVDIWNYYESFVKLIDACGMYAYYTKMHDRYPNNSYYSNKAKPMVLEIQHLTEDLAEKARIIDERIGRKEKLARLLIESKDRRKFYKSYLVRYWNDKNLLCLLVNFTISMSIFLIREQKRLKKKLNKLNPRICGGYFLPLFTLTFKCKYGII